MLRHLDSESLEAPRFLSSHKLGVVNVAILVPVVHVQDRVNHVGQLLVREELGCTVWGWLLPTLLSDVLAFLHVPMDKRLDEF